MASSQHRPQPQLPIYWDEKASSIFHFRHSASSAAVPSFSGPISCLPASEMALDQRGHAGPELTAHMPKVCPYPLRHAHSVMDSGPSLSPAPIFHPFLWAKRRAMHPPHQGSHPCSFVPSPPVSPLPPGVPPPPRDLVLATNLMVLANQHRGGGALLESLQADLGQDQGFSSMKRTSEIRELLFIFSLLQQSDGHLPFFSLLAEPTRN